MKLHAVKERLPFCFGFVVVVPLPKVLIRWV